jgi:hypothetical protein
MERDRQFSKKAGSFGVGLAAFQTFGQVTKSRGESLVISLAERPQEFVDHSDPAPSQAHQALRPGIVHIAANELFQQKTLKLSTVLRPRSVNSATTTV